MRRGDPFREPEELVRRLYAYVSYRIGPGPDAEDVTSDVLERALRYRTSYDARRGSPQTWVISIARRELASGPPSGRTTPVSDELADPGDVEQQTLLRLRIRAAVSELEGRDRELVALRYGAQLSPAEIGEMLELSRNAVDVALHRVRAKLRSLLADEDGAGSVEG